MIHVRRPHLHVPIAAIPGALALPVALSGVAAAGIAVLGFLVTVGPLALLTEAPVAPSTHQITATVTKYLNEWQPLVDPLVTLEGHVQVKSSNVYGIEIEGERYYYRFRNSFSYDPVSRGQAKDHSTVAVLDQGTQWEVEVYRLR